MIPLKSTGTSIFEASKTHSKLRLKDGVQFHLYINRTPCGDAAEFSDKADSYQNDR